MKKTPDNLTIGLTLVFDAREANFERLRSFADTLSRPVLVCRYDWVTPVGQTACFIPLASSGLGKEELGVSPALPGHGGGVDFKDRTAGALEAERFGS